MKRRRIRSPHPGIVLLPANAHHARRIRYKDPDRPGKFKIEGVDEELEGKELLRWLKRRSLWLQSRKLESRPPPTRIGLSVDEAIDQYLDTCKRLGEGTQDAYARSANRIQRWAGLPKYTHEFDLGVLTRLKTWLDRDDLQATSVNHHLRHLSPMFQYWRRAGLAPRLTKDAIAEGLKQLKAHPEPPKALKVAQIQELVVTLNGGVADPSSAGSRSGQSHRHPAFRKYVLLLLLGGLRAGEAIRVRPEFLEPERLRLPGTITKNHKTRYIDDYIAPSLRGILEEHAPRPEARMFWFQHQAALDWRFKLGVSFEWDFQQLRQTCGSYLANAGGIARSASVQIAAQRLGHEIATAEKYYLDQVIVDQGARTLEEAMGIDHLLPNCPAVV